MIKRLIKFGLVGGSGTVIGLGVLYFGTHVLGFYYLISYAIAFCVSVFSNYLLNTFWTFKKNTNPTFKGYATYIGTSLITLGVTTSLMYLFTTVWGVWYMLSSVIVTCCGFPVNYILSRKLVWRNN